MRAYRFALVPLFTGLLLGGCTEEVTGPGIGSGTELVATVNGQRLEMNINTDPSTTYYDSTLKQGYFSGTLVGTPSKTILLGFNSDIDKGTFPRTIGKESINIIYTEGSGTTALTYDCPNPAASCQIIVTNSNGQIVDGTFSATLTERTDPSKTVTITNGKFSVKLTRR